MLNEEPLLHALNEMGGYHLGGRRSLKLSSISGGIFWLGVVGGGRGRWGGGAGGGREALCVLDAMHYQSVWKAKNALVECWHGGGKREASYILA